MGKRQRNSLVTLHCDANGVPFLAGGAPGAHGAGAAEVAAALRGDLGPFELVPGRPVNRQVDRDERQPLPEVCLPYRQANRLGYVLRNRLPLLFVRNRHGQLLAEARTALAYAMSQPRRFADVLAQIRAAAPAVLVPPAQRRHLPTDVVEFIAQPYHSFAPGFFGIPIGVYAETSRGFGVWLGPLVNRPSVLPLRAGLVETDWHRRQLFLVTEAPDFDGDSLLIPGGTDLAQLWFVAYDQVEPVRHARLPPSEAIAYDRLWEELSDRLATEGRGILVHNEGVRTVSMECIHCRMSLPEAADDPPPEHSWTNIYVPTYKTLRRAR